MIEEILGIIQAIEDASIGCLVTYFSPQDAVIESLVGCIEVVMYSILYVLNAVITLFDFSFAAADSYLMNNPERLHRFFKKDRPGYVIPPCCDLEFIHNQDANIVSLGECIALVAYTIKEHFPTLDTLIPFTFDVLFVSID